MQNECPDEQDPLQLEQLEDAKGMMLGILRRLDHELNLAIGFSTPVYDGAQRVGFTVAYHKETLSCRLLAAVKIETEQRDIPCSYGTCVHREIETASISDTLLQRALTELPMELRDVIARSAIEEAENVMTAYFELEGMSEKIPLLKENLAVLYDQLVPEASEQERERDV